MTGHISYSELEDWNTCREKHRLKWDVGLRLPDKREPMLGTLGHELLKMLYRGEDWRYALDVWVAEESRKAREYEVAGDEFGFEVNNLELENAGLIGNPQEDAATMTAIIDRYVAFHDDLDRCEIVASEKSFSTPLIPGLKFKGRWDLILRDKTDGTFIGRDFKFLFNAFWRDEVELEMDGQIGSYWWSMKQCGYPLERFDYDQILFKIPAEPSILKTKNKLGGKVGLQEIYTDWPTFETFVRSNVEEGNLPPSEIDLLPEYAVEMIPKLSKKDFFRRQEMFRSDIENENFERHFKARGADFKRNQDNKFMEPSRQHCNFCDFKELCLRSLRGEDVWAEGGFVDATYLRRGDNESDGQPAGSAPHSIREDALPQQ